MRVVKKILRFVLICTLAIPFLWFGLRYGQPPKPAYGEIFRELSGPLLLQYRHFPPDHVASNWRVSRVNNNFIYYRVDKGEGSIHSLFDSLERSMISGQGAHLPPQVLEAGGPGEKPDTGPSFQAVPVFRLEWEDWGALGFVILDQLHKQGAVGLQPTESPDLLVPEQPFSSGALIAILAFLNKQEEATTYLTFWFDESFDFRDVLPAGEDDAPGRDATGVPRYPGLKRQYTFEEMGDGFESMMVVYSGRGNFHSIANFYRARMAGLGWELKEIPESSRRGKKLEEVLFFIQKGRECVIYVGSSSAPASVQAIVSVREARVKG